MQRVASSNVPTCASIPDKQAFIRTLYDRIAQDEVMPPSGKLALVSLHIGTSTFAFRPNDGAGVSCKVIVCSPVEVRSW
ncbi:MAG TPA: hypothetical protein VEC93_24545 [Anaerolineae bacterium]|nr:hypothetical protein [Anaerolineae bacterium]